MYIPITPETGAKRIADYRKRHPDRVEAYNAQRRARRQACRARVEELKLPARQNAVVQMALPATPVPAPLLLPAPPVRLCLPAPAEEPMFILPLRKPEPVLVEAAHRDETHQRRATA